MAITFKIKTPPPHLPIMASNALYIGVSDREVVFYHLPYLLP